VFALAMLALSYVSGVIIGCLIMAVSGAAWTMTMSALNVSAQLSVPNWVQGRALACYQVVLQGAMAVGSALWGFTAGAVGVRWSLALAGGAIAIGLLSMLRFRLIGDNELDSDPAPHRPPPQTSAEIRPDSGPVMVTIEYIIEPQRAVEFERAMQPLGQIRFRDGAVFWGVFFDAAQPERFVEYYMVESWVEHLRQHERGVLADLEIEDRVKSFHVGTSPRVVAHLVSAKSVAELHTEFFAHSSAPEPLRAGQA
jgi:hypothetical protein